VPSARSPAAISSVSLARSGACSVDGPCETAASTRARAVIDFEPGSATVARTGATATGAGHGCGGELAAVAAVMHKVCLSRAGAAAACVTSARRSGPAGRHHGRGGAGGRSRRADTLPTVCGRYATTRSAADLSALFEAVDDTAGLAPRYNVAPTDPVPLVRMSRRRGERVLSVASWGLLPAWARDPRVGSRMINARAETVATARAYAAAFAGRRALVPADGWFEWRRDGRRRQAYFLTPADGEVLALAGLWSRWGEPGLLTFSVVTTAAAGDLEWVHDRMPLVLPASRWREWLTGEGSPALLRPPPAELVRGLEVRPVGPRVGNVRNDDADLLTRVDPPPAADTLW
jgi:putative SOS response-associated peptidase YedK